MRAQKMGAGHSLLDAQLVKSALWDAVRKLSPRAQWANPVMFVVYLGAVLTSLLWGQGLLAPGGQSDGLVLAIGPWLWVVVLFANFAEALAEGRSRAQAASLRGMKRDTVAKVLQQPQVGSAWIPIRASELRKGVLSDWVVVEVTVNPGESFLDRMISMVESAKRQKTPNEMALTILLVGLT